MAASATASNLANGDGTVAETADVVIVGGGIVGASIAYYLADAGCTNVLVLEREPHLGRGSTGKSMGGVRAQFSTEINIRLSLYALDFFARFEEATGCPAGYRPQGYLFVATSEKHLDYLRTNYQLQVACGVKTAELLSPAEVLRRMPHLRCRRHRRRQFQFHRRICGPVQRHDRLHAARHRKRRASVEGRGSHGDFAGRARHRGRRDHTRTA